VFNQALVAAIGSGSTVTLTGQTTILSNGTGGNGSETGGNGYGGFARIVALDGGLATVGGTNIDASALGGLGSSLGMGLGGTAQLLAADGTLNGGPISLLANGSSDGGTA
jgi:hypothetical protein